MAFSATHPVPLGFTNSVSNLQANTASRSFDIQASEGHHLHIITWQPADPNNPGQMVLYNSSGVAQLTMNVPGHYKFYPPLAGATYYFKGTALSNVVAMTRPTNVRGGGVF